MFQDAIAKNRNYIVPVLTGIKYYGSDKILNGIATMIALNDEGWFLTCKHVVNNIIAESIVNNNYLNFLKELEDKKEHKEVIEMRYNLRNDKEVLVKNLVPLGRNESIKYQCINHDYLDLAVLHIENLDLKFPNYPIFSEVDCVQGKSLCKLGFPFPDYDYFELDDAKTSIVIKEKGIFSTPTFPLDGIMTRGLIDGKGSLSMFEMSSPGLRGQSGGPIFDSNGILYGIQVATRAFDLDFDFNGTIIRGVDRKQVNVQSFLHLGIGINSSTIRNFLDTHKIRYKVSG